MGNRRSFNVSKLFGVREVIQLIVDRRRSSGEFILIDHFKEDKQAFHRYLFHDIKYPHAKAWCDSLPVNRRNGFVDAVNEVNDKDVL